MFALRVATHPCSCPHSRWFLGDVIHLMFAYLLLPGKLYMFVAAMRSCLKIDQLPSLSCPSVCSMVCQVLPAQTFVPVAVQAVHSFPPPLRVSFLQGSSALVVSFGELGKSSAGSWISLENQHLPRTRSALFCPSSSSPTLDKVQPVGLLLES